MPIFVLITITLVFEFVNLLITCREVVEYGGLENIDCFYKTIAFLDVIYLASNLLLRKPLQIKAFGNFLPGSEADENKARTTNRFIYQYVSKFGSVRVKHGHQKIIDYNAFLQFQSVRSKQPKIPLIQILLKQAFDLEKRLKTTPSLSRRKLAKELKISTPYLLRILNLLNLAPQIQHYILVMQPSTRASPITENRLKYIAKHTDQKFQLREFERMLPQEEKKHHNKSTASFPFRLQLARI